MQDDIRRDVNVLEMIDLCCYHTRSPRHANTQDLLYNSMDASYDVSFCLTFSEK